MAATAHTYTVDAQVTTSGEASVTLRGRTISFDGSAERQDAPPKIIAVHYELRVTTEEPAKRVELLPSTTPQAGATQELRR